MKSMFQTMFQKAVPLVCVLALTACGGAKKTATVEIPTQPEYDRTPLVEGTGETVVAGDLVTVTYTGYKYDRSKPNARGEVFESGSRSFAAGTGAILPGTTYTLLGWDMGVPGMKLAGGEGKPNGKVNLILPYYLAYGVHEYTSTTGVKLPIYTPVVFEVEVTALKKASQSASVKISNDVPGTGAAVEYGKTYSAKYTFWLSDDKQPGVKIKQVQTSTDGSFTFSLGGQIKGWDRGVLGMKVGGKRTLEIPSELGYGVTGLSTTDSAGVATVVVPPNTPLIYDIEIVGVK